MTKTLRDHTQVAIGQRNWDLFFSETYVQGKRNYNIMP